MPKRLPLTLREYLVRTRGRAFTAIAVIALLAVYEAGLLLVDANRRNAADVLLKDILTGVGPRAVQAFHGVLLLLFLMAVFFYWLRSRSIVRYLLPFLAESMLWAVLLAPAVFLVSDPYLARAPGSDALLDLGAGVYEEIVFRLLLLRGLVFVFGVDPYIAFFPEEKGREGHTLISGAAVLIVPVLVSAIAFAAYHHIGPGADPWTWPLFTFRFVAGLLLAMLFFVRGLAVCVYTHAVYDLMLHAALVG